MEAIHTYRHVVPKSVVEDFEKIAIKVSKKMSLKKLGFIALMIDKSKNEFHDIDLLMFPKKDAKLGEAMIELVKYYNAIEKELQKNNERYFLATCPKMVMQEFMYYIASIEEGHAGLIPIHSMFFPDYKSFLAMSPKKFAKKVELGQDIILLHGDFSEVKKIKPLPQRKLEPYFFVLDFELNARIKTFPRHIIRASTEHLFNYLKVKYNIPIKDKIPHNVNELEKEFTKLMRTLDKRTYK